MSRNTKTIAIENPASEGSNTDSLKSESKHLNGRWTKEEHQCFVEAIKIYGKNWKKVEECVSTRNGAQIRSHAQKFFLRLEKDLKNKQTNQKGKNGNEKRKSIRKISEGSISTNENQPDNLSDLGQPENNLKGNLPLHEICENMTEASENTKVLHSTSESPLIATEKSAQELKNIVSKNNEMQIEDPTYSKSCKPQLNEEKVKEFNQILKKLLTTATIDTTVTTSVRTPFLGKVYHHQTVYLDLMSYFAKFNKTSKTLKLSDFVDFSRKTSIDEENSYELPIGGKRVKQL